MHDLKLTRRRFLKSLGAVGALAAAGGGLSAFLPALGRAEDAPVAKSIPKLVPTVCGMCDAQCGLLAYVQDGRLLKLEGNWSHSHSLGRICARGSAALKTLYDPDRLKSPLKRVGEGKFEEISWERAFEEVGERLRQLKAASGPQTLALLHTPGLIDEWENQFMAGFGSPNVFTGATTSHNASTAACVQTLGDVPVFDLDNARYILFFGRNLAESMFVSDSAALAHAKERGAHIVVVDPRLTHTAAFAHEWVPIRPGTDGALLLAMMNVIVEQGLYDRAFVSQHVNGFAELEAFLSDKTPTWAAGETQVSAQTITRIAQDFAAAKPACGVDPSRHGAWGSMYGNSMQTARAALALNALAGSYGAQGGLLMPNRPDLGTFAPPPVPPVEVERVDGVGGPGGPLVSAKDGIVQKLPDAIISGRPYPVRAMIVNHCNPARSLPNTSKVMEALRKLDLLVVIDTQMSDTAEFADYVLPESTFLEREDPIIVSQRLIPEVALRQPVVEPLYDTKPAYKIFSGLAEALGLGEYLTFGLADVNDARLAPTGKQMDELRETGVLRLPASRASGPSAFRTESGRVELYLESMQQLSANPLPAYESPQGDSQRGRFRFLHGKDRAHSGTGTQSNAYLHQLSPQNALWINPMRALALGISDGDRVLVSSEVGEVAVRARLTEGIHPDAVFLAHGYGTGGTSPSRGGSGGVNDNYLIADRIEPLAGSAAMGETLVKVKRL